MKPILLLQLRELDDPAEGELRAILKYGKLNASEVHRVRMEKESFAGQDLRDYSGVIVGGGPANVSDAEQTKSAYQKRYEKEMEALYKEILERDYSFLGICYGFGSVVKYAGVVIFIERYPEEVGHTTV